MTTRILQINSSSRLNDSNTRLASNKLVEALNPSHITLRDLTDGLPFIDEQWIGANYTAPEDRTDEHNEALSLSDSLVQELFESDVLVLGAPMYNFNIPAVLKAWIDLVARARLTFKYTEQGPVGLLENKKAYIVMASGGVPQGSDYDFLTPYLKHVLAFIGITDVTIVNANSLNESRLAFEKELANALVK